MATVDHKTELIGLLAALASTFGREADSAFYAGYRMALADLPVDAVKVAVRKAIRTCKFMPSGLELRELAGEMSPAARAIQAWEAFVRCVSRHGYYTSVSFDDPVINATVRNLGGWEHVCQLEGDDFDKWLRKDFERVYVSVVRHGLTPEQAAPLLGHFERQNRAAGYLKGDRLLLGNGTEQTFRITVFETGLPPHLSEVLRLTPTERADVPHIEFKKSEPSGPKEGP